MFTLGATVKNKISKKIGTVTEALEGGMIKVRFDGDTGTVPLHHTRFEAHYTTDLEQPFSYMDPETFKKGDYIKVRNSNGVEVKGAALNDVETFGYSTFEVLTDDGQLLDFNANYVTITVLFRADIARGQMPNY